MIKTFAFANYRSLRELNLSVGRLTAITGANGTGKSNVYRALRLLVDAANGELGRSFAREGGLPSAMWAGAGSDRRLRIGFADDNIAYELHVGFAALKRNEDLDEDAFASDPHVKAEVLRTVVKPKVNLFERTQSSAMFRDFDGNRQTFAASIDLYESVLSQLAEPHRYPAASQLRERLRRWRFYHQFRTDADSPMRALHIGTRTLVLSHDGHDLASALHTILAIGDRRALENALAEAFDGAQLDIEADAARFALRLHMPGVRRPLEAAELSDGTLRYLALVAALLSPRPPELLVLNEPETSLHPRLLEPLAGQIVEAAKRSQVIVVSHAAPLVDAIAKTRGAIRIDLAKEDGATIVAGRHHLDEPPWKWTA